MSLTLSHLFEHRYRPDFRFLRGHALVVPRNDGMTLAAFIIEVRLRGVNKQITIVLGYDNSSRTKLVISIYRNLKYRIDKHVVFFKI